MKRKKSVLAIVSIIFILLLFHGCKNANPLNAKNPVTLTMWHNFGGDMQNTMDMLLDEFNSTLGKEEGIIINVTAISSSKDLQEKLDMIVNGEPGAPEIPDIFTAYPKTAIQFQQMNLLVNLDDYFTKDELVSYIPSSLQEGRFGENGLYVFPFAKSTEIMYLNKTLFDLFSAETDVKTEDLSTIEGILQASNKYYKWTDAKTPSVENDGKMFFTADSWLNFSQAAVKQQGAELFQNNTMNLDQQAYIKLWKLIYTAAAKGGIAIYDGYSSDLAKTGDLVCSTGSSAGIIFYGDTITYPDNTIEKVEYDILPFPVISGGKKVAIQRGNGLCVTKSTKAEEYAASVFLKWFTDPEQNIRFISSTGYLPVTNEAFQEHLQNEISTTADSKVKEMLIASLSMYNNYEFFTAPTFNLYDETGKEYEENFKSQLKDAREAYLNDSGNDLEVMAEAALNLLVK